VRPSSRTIRLACARRNGAHSCDHTRIALPSEQRGHPVIRSSGHPVVRPSKSCSSGPQIQASESLPGDHGIAKSNSQHCGWAGCVRWNTRTSHNDPAISIPDTRENIGNCRRRPPSGTPFSCAPRRGVGGARLQFPCAPPLPQPAPRAPTRSAPLMVNPRLSSSGVTHGRLLSAAPAALPPDAICWFRGAEHPQHSYVSCSPSSSISIHSDAKAHVRTVCTAPIRPPGCRIPCPLRNGTPPCETPGLHIRHRITLLSLALTLHPPLSTLLSPLSTLLAPNCHPRPALPRHFLEWFLHLSLLHPGTSRLAATPLDTSRFPFPVPVPHVRHTNRQLMPIPHCVGKPPMKAASCPQWAPPAHLHITIPPIKSRCHGPWTGGSVNTNSTRLLKKRFRGISRSPLS
jgi:hypothetical protein